MDKLRLKAEEPFLSESINTYFGEQKPIFVLNKFDHIDVLPEDFLKVRDVIGRVTNQEFPFHVEDLHIINNDEEYFKVRSSRVLPDGLDISVKYYNNGDTKVQVSYKEMEYFSLEDFNTISLSPRNIELIKNVFATREKGYVTKKIDDFIVSHKGTSKKETIANDIYAIMKDVGKEVLEVIVKEIDSLSVDIVKFYNKKLHEKVFETYSKNNNYTKCFLSKEVEGFSDLSQEEVSAYVNSIISKIEKEGHIYCLTTESKELYELCSYENVPCIYYNKFTKTFTISENTSIKYVDDFTTNLIGLHNRVSDLIDKTETIKKNKKKIEKNIKKFEKKIGDIKKEVEEHIEDIRVLQNVDMDEDMETVTGIIDTYMVLVQYYLHIIKEDITTVKNVKNTKKMLETILKKIDNDTELILTDNSKIVNIDESVKKGYIEKYESIVKEVNSYEDKIIRQLNFIETEDKVIYSIHKYYPFAPGKESECDVKDLYGDCEENATYVFDMKIGHGYDLLNDFHKFFFEKPVNKSNLSYETSQTIRNREVLHEIMKLTEPKTTYKQSVKTFAKEFNDYSDDYYYYISEQLKEKKDKSSNKFIKEYKSTRLTYPMVQKPRAILEEVPEFVMYIDVDEIEDINDAEDFVPRTIVDTAIIESSQVYVQDIYDVVSRLQKLAEPYRIDINPILVENNQELNKNIITLEKDLPTMEGGQYIIFNKVKNDIYMYSYIHEIINDTHFAIKEGLIDYEKLEGLKKEYNIIYNRFGFTCTSCDFRFRKHINKKHTLRKVQKARKIMKLYKEKYFPGMKLF